MTRTTTTTDDKDVKMCVSLVSCSDHSHRSFVRSFVRSIVCDKFSLLFSSRLSILFSFSFALEPNICLYLSCQKMMKTNRQRLMKEKIYHSTPSPLLSIVDREKRICAFPVFFYRIASDLFRSLDSRD